MGKYSDVEALLIEEVRKYSVLWNTSNPDYKNKTKKENAWIAVSVSVNEESGKTYSAADYRDKIWKSLRDHYVRAISGSSKKSGAGRDDLLKYPHLDAISFIKPFVNIRASNAVSNIQSSVNDEEESLVPAQHDDQLQISDQESDGENPTPSGDSPTGEVKLGASKTKVKQSEKEIVSKKGTKRSYARISQKDIDKVLDVKILDYLNTSDSKEESKEMPVDENGDISFGQSVAAQLRNMNTRQNAFAKAKIQMLLLEVQFPEGPSQVMSVANTNYLPSSQNRFNYQLPDPREDSPTRSSYVSGSYFHKLTQ